MSSLMKKKGVWVFLASVVLFFSVPSYLGWRASQNPQSGTSEQGFDAQGIHTLRIEKDGNSTVPLYRSLNMRIVEPATRVSVSFDSNVYALQSRVEGDVLVVTFKVPDKNQTQRRRAMRGNQGEEILVPPSIQNLEFANAGNLRVSTETLTDLAALHVGIADCRSTVNFESMKVEKLVVSKRCQPVESADGYHGEGSIRFVQVGIKSLEIASTYGGIDLEDSAKVDALQLNLGDTVTVSARAAMLRKARFGPVPQ